MAAVDVTGPGAGIALTKDIYVNNGLVGPFDSTSDVNVFLEDTGGNPITPTSSVLVGNDLTITANIPNPSGVALQFPTPSQYPSYTTGDVGWRAQNAWFNYTPPTYPAKYAELAENLGANNWYRLKTALTVGGVTSTERFVDVNGVQSWGILNNANLAVVDKLTGLMFRRGFAGNANYATQNSSALAYSVTINGQLYDDWYLMSLGEYARIFAGYVTSNNWLDPISGLTITSTLANNSSLWLSDSVPPNSFNSKMRVIFVNGFSYYSDTFNTDPLSGIYVRNASNLIS